MADGRWREIGVLEGLEHAGDGPCPARRGGGDVVRVTRAAIPRNLGQDRRAASHGVVPFLEDEKARALAHHEPVPVGVKRA